MRDRENRFSDEELYLLDEKVNKHLEGFKEHEKIEFEHHTNQQRQLDEIKETQEELINKLETLLDAWNTLIVFGRGLTSIGRAIKYLAILATSLTAIVAAFNHWPKQ